MNAWRTVRGANSAVWRVVDWRYLASLAAAGFVAAIIASLITQADARRDADARATQALDAQTASRQAASRRIDLLNDEIGRLEQLLIDAETDRSELSTSVAALSEQVRRLGARPIVVTTTARPAPAGPSTTTTRPTTTTTTTAGAPPATTTTARPCTTRPVVGCLPIDP